MKRILIGVILGGFACNALAQATIWYVNNGTGLRAPVYIGSPLDTSRTGNTTAGLPTGTEVYHGPLVTGSNYRAQLFGASGLDMPEYTLTAATTVNTFRTGSAAGFLGVVLATLPSIPKDAPLGATLQLRVWDNSSGLYPDWASAEVAWTDGLISAGKSDVFNAPFGIMGGDLVPPRYPLGLTSFSIQFIPEPTTFALAALGMALMFIRRRQ